MERTQQDKALLYEQIFRRKSFHKFPEIILMTQEDVRTIQEVVDSLEPLVKEIRTAVRIVRADETNCRRGAEYCVLFYSEDVPNAHMNIGYMGEQLDLELVAKGFGTLWYGLGKSEEKKYDGLDFVIMIAVSKVPGTTYRKDMFKAKRKDLDTIWEGDTLPLSNIVRYSPSACNSQPWLVRNTDGHLDVFRFRKKGFTGMIPMAFVAKYNRIDIGIFLFILEVCLLHDSLPVNRTLFVDNSADDVAYTKVASYDLSL